MDSGSSIRQTFGRLTYLRVDGGGGQVRRFQREGQVLEHRAALDILGQALMENRHGLLVDFQVTTATGTAERDVVPQLIDDARVRGFHPKTLGADKGYDTQECVRTMRDRGVTPHVAQNMTWS